MHKIKLWLELDHIKINPLRLSKRCESIQKERERERERERKRGTFLKYINNSDINTFVSHYIGNEQH